MFLSSYVRQLCDTIISDQPLSYDQLFFLVDIVAEYSYEYEPDFYDDFDRARLSLLRRSNYTEGGE